MDKGIQLTNKQLAQVEKQLAREYAKSTKELRKMAKKRLAELERKDKEKAEQVAEGRITQEEYIEWRKSELAQSKSAQSAIRSIARKHVDTDRRAAAIIGASLAAVYVLNHAYATYQIEKAVKRSTGYVMKSETAVEKLIKRPTINVAKDYAWHNRKINSALVQGLVRGESIDKVAERLEKIGVMDRNAALRNARTMIGSVQNEAKLDSYKRAEDMGIKLKKTWVATMDDRVRDSHAELDGETIPLDEEFSNGLMFPKDPKGDPAEVYNCRCEMVSQVEGFERDVTDLGLRPASVGSYEEWKEAHTGKRK